jgi:hypothetical protein
VLDYVERFYNVIRRHSTIGYLSPVEFRAEGGIGLTSRPLSRQAAQSICRQAYRLHRRH